MTAGSTFARDLTILLAASLPVVFVCRKLRLPVIVGFLVAGVAIGPHGFGVLADPERVRMLSELGVELILFFVGLEFPPRRIRALGRDTLVGGPLQMSLTVALFALVGFGIAGGIRTALFHGILLCLSSTAVILPLLKAKDEVSSPHAKSFLGVSIFQDLAVIPLALLLPALGSGVGGGAPPTASALAGRTALALLGVALLVGVARLALPKGIELVGRLRSREAFTAAIVLVVLAMIGLAKAAGVSAALGTFAAGIVLSESDFVHEISSTLAPFRDLFTGLFFASIGMLLDPGFVARNPVLVGGGVLTVFLVKVVAAYPAIRAAGGRRRSSFRAALALAPVGELSFLLAQEGRAAGLLTPPNEQVFIAIAVVSLGLAPLLLAAGGLVNRFVRDGGGASGQDGPDHHGRLSNHVVVIGYGLNGRNVGRVLASSGIPHVVVEENPDRIAEARADGVHVVLADASSLDVLESVAVSRAAGIVVAISDPAATRRIVRLANRQNPNARIIVRTRYVAEVEALRDLGADEVIPEEFETSIEIVTRVLRLLHVPGNVIAAHLRVLRDETYKSLRDPARSLGDAGRLSALVAAGTADLFLVFPGSYADGRSLAELRLDGLHVAVPALLRDGEPHPSPPSDWTVLPGDVLLLSGAHEDLMVAMARLEKSDAADRAG